MITLESVSGYRNKMDQRNNRHHRHRQSSPSSMNHQEDCDRIPICPLSCPSCLSMSRIPMRIKIPQSFHLSEKSNIEMKSSYVRMKCNQIKKCNESKKSYLIPSSLFASLITISSLINFVECKGGAARAGAGAGSGKLSCIPFVLSFSLTFFRLSYLPVIILINTHASSLWNLSLSLFQSYRFFCLLLLQISSLHRLWISWYGRRSWSLINHSWNYPHYFLHPMFMPILSTYEMGMWWKYWKETNASSSIQSRSIQVSLTVAEIKLSSPKWHFFGMKKWRVNEQKMWKMEKGEGKRGWEF